MKINTQSTYEKLIYEINKMDSDADKIFSISEYILNNVDYNYLYSDNKKMNDYCNKLEDDNIFKTNENAENKELTESMFYDLCDKLGISTDYRMMLNKKYEKLIDTKDHELDFFSVLPSVKTSPVYNKGILKFGVSIDIAKFVKQLCEDSRVSCELVRTKENPEHVWNVIEVDGEKLNFDLTYAIYSRDKYNDIDKMSAPTDWLGVADENMANLYAVRELHEASL